MKAIHKFLILLCLCLPFTAHASDTGYKAWMEPETDISRLHIVALAQSEKDGVIRYELTANKQGQSGKSTSKQSGNITLHNGAKEILSRLTLSIMKDDEYEIHLRVFKDETLVAEDHITYPLPKP